MAKFRLVQPGSDSPKGEQSLSIDPDTMEARHKVGLSDLLIADDTAADDSTVDAATARLQAEHARFRAILPPDLADRHFADLTVLTNGGMGLLFAATERDLSRQIALKVIIPSRKDEDGILDTFIREARLTAQLPHPNIVPIHRMGFLPDQGAYYTMRLIEGESLLAIIKRLAANDPDTLARYDYLQILEIFRKIADAVAFAHSRGIIHRDIKPANIMVGPYGDVILLDWGLAKQIRQVPAVTLDPEPESAFMKRILKGSPSYMSPEQAKGDDDTIDERTDVFLLGATLYHALTLAAPYRAGDLRQIIRLARDATYEPPDSPRFRNTRVPAAVAAIITRAMQPDPADRYQCVQHMLADIDAVVHGNLDFQTGSYAAGDLIIRQGDAADALYYIVEGEVVVYLEGKLGLVRELERVGPGEIVGELALISDKPRQASVKAVTDVQVLILPSELFQKNIQRLPPWLSKLLECLAGRLLAANEQNRDLHLRPKFLPW